MSWQEGGRWGAFVQKKKKKKSYEPVFLYFAVEWERVSEHTGLREKKSATAAKNNSVYMLSVYVFVICV